jgi:hypothetical protein
MQIPHVRHYASRGLAIIVLSITMLTGCEMASEEDLNTLKYEDARARKGPSVELIIEFDQSKRKIWCTFLNDTNRPVMISNHMSSFQPFLHSSTGKVQLDTRGEYYETSVPGWSSVTSLPEGSRFSCYIPISESLRIQKGDKISVKYSQGGFGGSLGKYLDELPPDALMADTESQVLVVE